MAKAIVTPKDLRDFAKILKQNIEDFDYVEKSMNDKLYHYDWRDVVADRFKIEFEAIKTPLNQLRQKMEEFIPHLEEKTRVLEGDYLGNDSSNANWRTAAAAGGAATVGAVGGAAAAKSPNPKDNDGINGTTGTKKDNGKNISGKVEHQFNENIKGSAEVQQTDGGTTGTVKVEGQNVDNKISVEGEKKDGGPAKVTVKGEIPVSENTTVSGGGQKTERQGATIFGEAEYVSKDTTLSVKGQKTEGQDATIFGNVKQQVSENTTLIGRGQKTDGQDAAFSGKVEHQFSKDIKGSAEVEVQTARGVTKGAAKIEISNPLKIKDAKASVGAEMSKKASGTSNYAVKADLSIPFGGKTPANNINLNQLTEQDIQVLHMNNIYPTEFDKLIKNGRDKYKEILDKNRF